MLGAVASSLPDDLGEALRVLRAFVVKFLAVIGPSKVLPTSNDIQAIALAVSADGAAGNGIQFCHQGGIARGVVR